jgi:hypothetical protein
MTIDSSGQWLLGFHAREHSTDYAEHNVYVVSTTRPAPLRVPLTRSSAPARPGFVRIERNTAYLTDVPLDADPWLWDWLVPGEPWPYDWWDPTLGTFALPDLPAQVPETVPVQVRLLGYSQHEHTFEATLNGVLLGQVTFAGRGVALLEGSVPGSVLRTENNSLTLRYEATPLPDTDPYEWAAAYLDDLELGLPTAPRVAPIANVSPYSARLPKLRDAEYLIVTHGLFLEGAHRLAELKRQEGLEAVVVDVERAYDRFSGGFVEPRAVKALIRHAARRSGRLRFVVLLGDDTFDPRDFVEMGAVSYIPSMLAWDDEFGRIPSENPYADLDGDGRPEVAIGRLPVQTVEQAQVVVDKIASQQEVLARAAGRHLFAVDNSGDADLPFREEADAVAAGLPAGSAVAWADIAAGIVPARETLDTAWNVGAQMTHYFGHGGPEIWADEHLLSTDDLAARLAASQPTVLFAWTCQTQWYLNIWGPAINEALFLLPEGGALASFGPTGITPPAGQKPLFERFYGRVFIGGEVTLGEAIRDAKRLALEDEPGALSAVEGFSLIGDPALRLSADPSP